MVKYGSVAVNVNKLYALLSRPCLFSIEVSGPGDIDFNCPAALFLAMIDSHDSKQGHDAVHVRLNGRESEGVILGAI